MDPFKEKATGCALVLGAFLMLGAGTISYLLYVEGMHQVLASRNAATGEATTAGDLVLIPVAILIFVVGLALCSGAVFYGLVYSKRQASGPRRTIEDALILSRYALSPRGDFLSDWELEGAEDPRFFVRMRTPDGRAAEYPVAQETYFNCGEGMAGEAEMQGRWVGRFTPYIGPRPAV